MTENYLCVKILKNGTQEEVIIEAEDWDDALLVIGSICAFDDDVVDYTCDLATDSDVARVEQAEKEAERKALEDKLEGLLMMQYNYKRASFGCIPRENSTPYDTEIAEIRQKLGD